MFSLRGKTAVITGAASGIGRELAIGLAREGCALAISDIDKKGLGESAELVREAGAAVSAHLVDVSNRRQVERFARETVKAHGHVDLLVNNAGVTLLGRFQDTSIEDLEWIAGVNLWGAVYCAHAFLPHLLARPRAQMVNLSSVFGIIGVPMQTGYCATKFGVRGFTEALRRDLKGTNVSVMCVHPGGIRTNIARHARFAGLKGDPDAAREKFARRFERMAITSPGKAAQTLIRAIRSEKKRLVIGIDAKLISLIQRVFPASYDRLMDAIYG